ncbi:MAG: hypothetical protein AAFP22_02990 [Planctomycetota bacterium]
MSTAVLIAPCLLAGVAAAQTNFVYVDPNAPTSSLETGTSWSNAVRFLEDAWSPAILSTLPPGQDIIVVAARAVYYPRGTNGNVFLGADPSNRRNWTFNIPGEITGVWGGFVVGQDPATDQPGGGQSMLSGDVFEAGGSPNGVESDNANHVVTVIGGDTQVLPLQLRNLIIHGGHSSPLPAQPGDTGTGSGGSVQQLNDPIWVGLNRACFGAGLFASGRRIEMSDSFVRNCYAVGGGGIWLDFSTFTRTELVGNRVVIEDNTAQTDGGGILAMPTTSLLLHSAVLRDNRAGRSGGGAWFDGESTEIRLQSSIVDDNEGASLGGGLY